jgi:TPR repeat protein
MRYTITLALSFCTFVSWGQAKKAQQAPADLVKKETAKAAKGDTGAMRRLGELYYYGVSTPQNFAKANEWLLKAANKGNTDAMILLASLYEDGEGVKKDIAKTIEWLKKATIKGNSEAMVELAGLYDEGEGIPKNLAEAAKYYQMAADKGNTDGMIGLGLAYMEGKGIKEDQQQALNWLQKAVDKGNPSALRYLADYYEEPDMGNDCPKAVECYMRAADLGDTLSLKAVGEIIMAGTCPTADTNKIIPWMINYADKGYGDAAYFMARFHIDGRGVKQSYGKAMDYFIKDAEFRMQKGEYQSNSLKNLFVLYNVDKLSTERQARLLQWLESTAAKTNDDYMMAGLGYIYTNKDQATKEDYKAAMSWSQKAANKGNSTGYYNIGYLYTNGLGVTKDPKMAFDWILKAAKKGDNIAMLTLADFYEKGEGTTKDLNKAAEWKKKAENEKGE